MSLNRRQFLAGSGSAVGLASAAMIFGPRAKADRASLMTGNHLELLPGFTDSVIDRWGNVMSDGYPVPQRPDGMACFRLKSGELALMRNHELLMGKLPEALKPFAYNPQMEGAVTRLVLDEKFNVKSSNYVVIGTAVNCAGGPSPWGWLTCEEIIYRDHGYVFACDPEASSVQMPRKIPAYGRFTHEAAAVDPTTMIAYLTEDQGDSCFYRFLPDDPAEPFRGKLQAMTAGHKIDVDALRTGDSFEVTWIDIEDPLGEEEQPRYEGARKGALEFRRGEGLFFAGGEVYFTASGGGPVGQGQVFHYSPRSRAGGKLRLLAQATGEGLASPDNLTLGPSGNIFLCEDKDEKNHIYALKPNGELVLFARNFRSASEFTGICFDPTGRHMFVNLQEDGITLRISGPFGRF